MTERINNERYELFIMPYGIRIERRGASGKRFGVHVYAETLFRNGWNSIADAARLIEERIAE